MRKVYIDCGVWEGDSILTFKKYFKNYEIYGFECEPRLKEKLVLLSSEQNFNLTFKAVYTVNGKILLYPGIKNFTESSSILSSKTTYVDKKYYVEVESIDFSRWVIDNFNKDDFIVCKMNIEGAEYNVLEKMIEDGSIYYINNLYVEWHNTKIKGISIEQHNNLKKELAKIVTLNNWAFVKNWKYNPFVEIPDIVNGKEL